MSEEPGTLRSNFCGCCEMYFVEEVCPCCDAFIGRARRSIKKIEKSTSFKELNKLLFNS